MFMIVLYIGLVLLGVYKFLVRKRLKGNVIDGPKGLPVLGCIHEINSETIHLKFTEYADKFGKIFRLKLLSENVIVLNTEELIRKALGGGKHKNHFGDRGEMFFGEHFRCRHQTLGFVAEGSGLFHRTARKSYTQALHTYGSGLQELENNVMVAIEDLIKKIENNSGKEFECVSMLKRSLTNVMSLVMRGETILDSDPDVKLFWDHVTANDFFLNSYNNFVMSTFPFLRHLPGEYGRVYRNAKRAQAKIAEKYFYDMKKSHVSGHERGIVDHYIEEQEKQIHSNTGLFFTDERIIGQLEETVDAGRGRLPTYADREKCKFFQAVELEVHRYLTVVPLMLPHLCKEHIEFEGYDIEANSTIFANVWYLHHNKEVWGDPWTFRPERFLDEHGDLLPFEHKLRRNVIAFGYGLRQCPGEMFAKTRYFLYISSLLQRWNFEFLPGKGRPCDPRLTENFELKVIMRAQPFFCIAKERKQF